MEDLTSKGFCAAVLYILMRGPCEDVFYLTIFQDYLYLTILIKVGVFLPNTVGGRCRCLRNVFTSRSVSSGNTYVL